MAQDKDTSRQDELIAKAVAYTVIGTILAIVLVAPKLIEWSRDFVRILRQHGTHPRILSLGKWLLVALIVTSLLAYTEYQEATIWIQAFELFICVVRVIEVGRQLDPVPPPPPPTPPVGELDSYLEPFEGAPEISLLPTLAVPSPMSAVWSVPTTTSTAIPSRPSPTG